MSDRQSIERVFPKKKVNDEIKSKGEVRKKTKKNHTHHEKNELQNITRSRLYSKEQTCSERKNRMLLLPKGNK